MAIQIYTTGAFLTLQEINGRHIWVADEFNDDSYKDGKLVDPDKIVESLSNKPCHCGMCGTPCGWDFKVGGRYHCSFECYNFRRKNPNHISEH